MHKVSKLPQAGVPSSQSHGVSTSATAVVVAVVVPTLVVAGAI
jgi:hypothetical protein